MTLFPHPSHTECHTVCTEVYDADFVVSNAAFPVNRDLSAVVVAWPARQIKYVPVGTAPLLIEKHQAGANKRVFAAIPVPVRGNNAVKFSGQNGRW